MFPLVREMAATGARIRVPVAVACRVLGLSTAGVLQVAGKDPVCQRDWDDAHAIDSLLRDIHEDDPTLGYRFLTDELADVGISRIREPRMAALLDRGCLRLPPPSPGQVR